MRVLITGATSGFGRGMVEEFLHKGATVLATGRRLSSRREIYENLRVQYKDRLHELDLDVTDAAQRRKVVEYCLGRFGGLDVLINNAGSGIFGAFEDCSEHQLRRQMEVNFFGTALMTKDFLPLLRKSRGKVFQFSSVLGLMSLPLTSLYSASKFAVEGLSEGLAYDLRRQGVQVCLIEPGSFRTEFMNSVEWAENALNPESPYNLETKNYKRLRESMLNSPNAADPKAVIKGVVRLAYRHSVPLRVPFGRDTALSRFFRWILPRQFFFRLTSRLFAFEFEKGG